MSLQKKIILSFLGGAVIIAMLSAFLYINFLEIKKETSFLELTDTVRSKSLQLRRHEKNYFLYAPEQATGESAAIYQYIGELDDILGNVKGPAADRTAYLRDLIHEYRSRFRTIEGLVNSVSSESKLLEASSPAYAKVSRLLAANFLDKPLEDVRYLREQFSFRHDHKLILGLTMLDVEISGLRKTGENILAASKELDRTAREKVDNFIHISRIAILLVFPLFLIVGFGTILYIVSGVVKRLRLITGVIEKTGKGGYVHLTEDAGEWGNDEVGQLITKFNYMEDQLEQREKELLRTKKLAAIGTLASGVAHELNNPLNNIYTSAQRLLKKMDPQSLDKKSTDSGNMDTQTPEFIKKGLNDIFGQTLRVKSIVGDLLEFAKGREPHHRAVALLDLVSGVFNRLKDSAGVAGVELKINMQPPEIVMYADPEQLEQVFINLFTNAADAMSGTGTLTFKAVEENDFIRMEVADTGPGMSDETLDKLFEPFYTTKDKGTGLGLAIVFNIIQKHHGEIRVATEKGKGSTFFISLPKALQG